MTKHPDETFKDRVSDKDKKEICDLIQVTSMADVEEKKVAWLYYPLIPRGKVTILQGDPGGGKTAWIMSVLAEMSKVRPLDSVVYGDYVAYQESIGKTCSSRFGQLWADRCFIYQTAEDGVADTIVPRLRKHGADLRKIMYMKQSDISFTDGKLEWVIFTYEPEIVVLDPLQAFLGSDLDMHRANEIRPAMQYLAELAEVTDTAIVLVGHLNKKSGDNDLYRGLGSIDLIAAARSVMLMERDKQDKNLRILRQIKNSLAPISPPLAYRFDEDGRLLYQGEYQEPVKEKPEKKAMLASYTLRVVLGAEEKPVEEVRKEVEKKHGVLSSSQWTEARKLAEVETYKKGKVWVMRVSPTADFEEGKGGMDG